MRSGMGSANGEDSEGEVAEMTMRACGALLCSRAAPHVYGCYVSCSRGQLLVNSLSGKSLAVAGSNAVRVRDNHDACIPTGPVYMGLRTGKSPRSDLACRSLSVGVAALRFLHSGPEQRRRRDVRCQPQPHCFSTRDLRYRRGSLRLCAFRKRRSVTVRVVAALLFERVPRSASAALVSCERERDVTRAAVPRSECRAPSPRQVQGSQLCRWHSRRSRLPNASATARIRAPAPVHALSQRRADAQRIVSHRRACSPQTQMPECVCRSQPPAYPTLCFTPTLCDSAMRPADRRAALEMRMWAVVSARERGTAKFEKSRRPRPPGHRPQVTR